MNNQQTEDAIWYRNFKIWVHCSEVDGRYRYIIYSNGRRVADTLKSSGRDYYEQSFGEAKLCVDKLIDKQKP